MEKLIARMNDLSKKMEEDTLKAKDEKLSVEERQTIIDGIKVDKKEYETIERQIQDKELEGLGVQKRSDVTSMMNGVTGDEVAEKEKISRKDVYSSVEYRNAWTESLRKENSGIVERFLSTATDASAGVLVPTELLNEIQDTFENDDLLQKFNITNYQNLTEMPIVETKTNPKWHQEVDAQGKPVKKERKSVTFGLAKLSPEYLAEILETTKKFEALTTEAFFEWLKSELPHALRRVILAAAFTAPQSGTYGLRGILTNTKDKLVAELKSALDFNVVNKAVGKLGNNVGEVTAVMNKTTFYDTILGLHDTSGQPIFKVTTDNSEKPKQYLNGIAVDFDDNIKTYDDAADGEPFMVVGALKAYQINFPLGYAPEITRDALTRKEDNIIEYLSEILVGGDITKRSAFVKVTKKTEA